MADKSKIEWTDTTWNPIVGCSKATYKVDGKTRLREGCRNCYAIRVAASPRLKQFKQYQGLTVLNNKTPEWTGKVNIAEHKLDEPLRWRKPRKVFVNSESDFFHPLVHESVILLLLTVMANSHIATGRERTHIFQILTKRPERMLDILSRVRWHIGLALVTIAGRNYMINYMPTLTEGDWVSLTQKKENMGKPPEAMPKGWMPPNIQWGVSVEDQPSADYAIPLLLKTPAAVRWISAEPLLGGIDIDKWVGGCEMIETDGVACPSCIKDQKLHWVVVGGENAPGARPMHPDWARLLRDQCEYAGIPYFFKQWGSWQNGSTNQPHPSKPNVIVLGNGTVLTFEEGTKPRNRFSGDGACVMSLVGKKAAGRLLDGREYNGYPG